MRLTNPARKTWLARPGTIRTLHLDGDEFGRRINVIKMDHLNETNFSFVEGRANGTAPFIYKRLNSVPGDVIYGPALATIAMAALENRNG